MYGHSNFCFVFAGFGNQSQYLALKRESEHTRNKKNKKTEKGRKSKFMNE